GGRGRRGPRRGVARDCRARGRSGRGRRRSGGRIRRRVSRPVAVAITGGIGAGKSEALAAFARHGAATVSRVESGRELLRRDGGRQAIGERFGNGVIAPDGPLDRGAVATIVFNDRSQLEWLENLLHPLVAMEYMQWREQLAHLSQPPKVCVTE